MNLNGDLILMILDIAYQYKADRQRWTPIKYQDIPGDHSHSDITDHFEHCERLGLIESKPTISATALVSLTPKGVKYLKNQA